MAQEKEQKPTVAELAILRVLWEQGPSTVREVMEHLAAEREMGYTTVLKFLQIMLGKGLVTRNEAGKTHVYAAGVPAEKMQRRLLGDLMEKVFAGSVSRLVMQALGAKKVSEAELREIRKLLDQFEGGGSKS